ncbi:MAG: DUF6783 domain-containing protein [Ruminococcus sp.]
MCGRFHPDEGAAAGYARIRVKYTAKWGQIAE